MIAGTWSQVARCVPARCKTMPDPPGDDDDNDDDDDDDDADDYDDDDLDDDNARPTRWC